MLSLTEVIKHRAIELQKKSWKVNLRGYLNTTEVFFTEISNKRLMLFFLVCVGPLELVSVLHSRMMPSVSIDPLQLIWIVIKDAL